MSVATLLRNGVRLDSAHPGDYSQDGLRLRCPLCMHSVGMVRSHGPSTEPMCSACGFIFKNRNGIWKALAPSREERFGQFAVDYQTVRLREGRGSSGSHFYLSLPYNDSTGRNSWQWKIRGRSFRFLERKILPAIEREYPPGLDVLDIGAGNGWLSYRLALRGHRPAAVDLLVNDQDGLGAARYYFDYLPQPFPRYQAEMDRLPFADRQFDAAVFNASFHYSEDYERTLEEVLRCLRRPGHVLVVDSPFYSCDGSGQRMVEERRAEFQKKYGFRSDSIPNREYLTPTTLKALTLGGRLTWKTLKPWYGVGWALRPLWARVRGRREPAKFYILWGTVQQP